MSQTLELEGIVSMATTTQPYSDRPQTDADHLPDPEFSGPGHGGSSSAAKVLTLISAFAGPRSVLGVTELAALANVPKSTAHRLLAVLVTQGFVRRVGDRYCLSEHLFELGNSVRLCRPNGLRYRAAPFLAELFAQTRQTIHLAVLRGTEVLYIDKLVGRDATRCDTTVGSRKPAYATALGKVILANSPSGLVERNLSARFKRYTPYTITGPTQLERALERARDTGFATDHEEYRFGVTCLAAPIRDAQTGNAVAGVSICGTGPMDLERKFARLLTDIADELSHNPPAAVPLTSLPDNRTREGGF